MYYYTNGMRFRHKELCQKIIPRLLRRRRGDNKENQARRQTKSHYPHTYKLEIEGMTCSNCSTRIENAFNTREGFYARADSGKQIVTLHTKHPLTESEAREIVKKAGYRVTSFQTIT